MFSALPGAGNCLPFYGWGPTIYTQPRGASSISNLGWARIHGSGYFMYFRAVSNTRVKEVVDDFIIYKS